MVGRASIKRVSPEWLLAGFVAAVMLTSVLVYRNATVVRPARLTVTAGSPDGLRHQIALRLARAAKRRDVTLDVRPVSGSEEALERVNRGEIDLALVQGGLELSGRERVRQIASLKIEPLHLVVKSELFSPAGGAEGLEFLRGRRVNLSERGSGTYEIAREVLTFAGLRPGTGEAPGDYLPATLSYAELMAEGDRTGLPDAAFMVSALPSPVVRHLVARHDFRLVPLRFGEAFMLDTLREPAPVRAGTPDSPVNRTRVYNCEIPAYTYGVSPPAPEAPLATFGTRLLLVGHEDVEASAVARLLESAYSNGHGAPVLDEALLGLAPEFDWHDGVVLYRERNTPLMIGDLDFLDKGAGLVGVVVPGLFYLWHLYRKWSDRRRERGFESYMLKVAAVEQEALSLELAGAADVKELVRLRLSLFGIKDEALRRFACGELEGQELISGFMTQVNAARDHLTRLILHERDNLEEAAAREGRSVNDLWNEAVEGLADSPGRADDTEPARPPRPPVPLP